jgi:hypothetical protein
MGGDVFEEMCKRNVGGEQKRKARQQATGDVFRQLRAQQRKKLPPRVAKYNVHGCDSLGVEWQGYGRSPQTTPSLVYRCEALGGAN